MRLVSTTAIFAVRRTFGRNTAKFLSECGSNRRPVFVTNTFRMMSSSQLSVPKKLDDVAKLGMYAFCSVHAEHASLPPFSAGSQEKYKALQFCVSP
jgi:hypothetical protein